MLTNNQLKLISSLSSKKYRYEHRLFIVEGEKGIKEFLNSNFDLHSLFTTTNQFGLESINISEKELKKISQLKTPNTALALFKMPARVTYPKTGLILALDAVRDPGNLGTIIRLCDWFGIKNLVCSNDTVDCYNSKVVQATMGSLARVSVAYVYLKEFLKGSKIPIYATTLTGESIYKSALPQEAILLMGNEANGISEDLLKPVHQTITIPRYRTNNKVESLNVAAATAICLNEFRRNTIET